MSLDPQRVSDEISEEGLGLLRGCLMDGDAEQRGRQRSIRRRSLAISIAVQSAILTALILVSLFGKPQSIALANVTPVPPFGHRPHHPGGNPKPPITRPPNSGDYAVFPIPNIRPIAHTGESSNPVGPPDFERGSNQSTDGPGCSWCVDIGSKDKGPQPPPDATVKPQVRSRDAGPPCRAGLPATGKTNSPRRQGGIARQNRDRRQHSIIASC